MGKEPESRLSEAREGLGQCRKLFFLSSCALLSEELTEKEKIPWGFVWLVAFREQDRLTREVLVPRKKEEGLPITNQEQEERVKKSLGNFAQSLGLPYESGVVLAKFHIKQTKIIQREEGVGRVGK
ncbi:MAG: hypothetical protein HYW64_01845 [Candidatus Levybacteria bacterium]|nr:hypothetical protein [Candidatus Levybacteria bacterium]MBI2622815.1 hypothetical protein [Candidatus Levybacteria bacterium]